MADAVRVSEATGELSGELVGKRPGGEQGLEGLSVGLGGAVQSGGPIM